MKTEWVHKKLGDNKVALIIMGQSPSSSTYNDDGIGLPFLQGCADFGEVFPKIKTYCSDSLKVAPANSILMSVRAPVGTINKADQKYVIGRGLCSIVPVIDGDFLYYYLLQNTHELELKAQGSTFLAINSLELNEMPISYPKSLSVQRRIAAILSSADKVIDSTRRLIEKYKKMKQGMMEELFNEQCTMNNVQWRKVRLGEVGEIISGGTPSTTNETFWDGDVLFVTPLDLGRKNKIDSTLRTISELGVKNSSANKIKAHSLAISTRAPIGLMSIVNQDFTTNQGCKSIQFYDSYDSEFFYYYLSYNVEKIQRYGQGTTFMEISKTDFSNLEFTVPDLSAQRRIVAILSGIDAKIAAAEKVLEKYEKVKKGLMERMLSSKN